MAGWLLPALPALACLLLAAASATGQDGGFRDVPPYAEAREAFAPSQDLESRLRMGEASMVDLRWEDIASWRDIPQNAVWCGYQYMGDDLARRERSYVARMYRGGGLLPGKATYWGASSALSNSTFANVPNFEVAVGNPSQVRWVPAYSGNVPPGAPAAGLSKEGQPLYACRFHSERRMSMACGAVQRFAERCMAEMDGNLMSSAVYEVLVLVYPQPQAVPSASRPLGMALPLPMAAVPFPFMPPGIMPPGIMPPGAMSRAMVDAHPAVTDDHEWVRVPSLASPPVKEVPTTTNAATTGSSATIATTSATNATVSPALLLAREAVQGKDRSTVSTLI